MWLYEELKRRNVIRVATAYVVAAWLAIQVVETVLPAFGYTEKAVRIVVILFGIGFVPAVIGAWVFQITPEGLIRDRGRQGDAAASPKAGRILDRAIIVLLVLGISYFAIDKFVIAPERAAEREAAIAEQARAEARLGYYGDRSIAVLPFDNLSPDPEQQYFVDGVAEEILNLLARIRDLRVISRSSSFTFRGADTPIPEIAERLNVGYVLEGSVRRAGDRVRVTAQLIEGRTDTHRWSHTYERELGDLFEIQDEIASDVVRNLELAISLPLPRSRPVDPEALALTQQAIQLGQIRPEGVGRKMYVLLERALEIDANYVPALEWMVLAQWLRAEEGYLSWDEYKRVEAELMQRIRELDPDNGSPDTIDGFNLAQAGRYEAAAFKYLQALSKDLRQADNIRIAGRFARRIGKLDVSRRLLEHALAVDPLCHQCRRRLAETLFYLRDYERAKREFERYRLIAAGADEVYFHVLLVQGETERLLELTADSATDQFGEGLRLAARAMARHSRGETAEAEALLTELIESEIPDSRYANFRVAEAAAWMGKNDLAFEILFELASSGFDYLRRRVYSPIWEGIRDDPRWQEWRELAGVSQARFDAIAFDPAMPE